MLRHIADAHGTMHIRCTAALAEKVHYLRKNRNDLEASCYAQKAEEASFILAHWQPQNADEICTYASSGYCYHVSRFIVLGISQSAKRYHPDGDETTMCRYDPFPFIWASCVTVHCGGGGRD